jgi:hypothetical protein
MRTKSRFIKNNLNGGYFREKAQVLGLIFEALRFRERFEDET